MDTPSTSVRELARQMMAAEAAKERANGQHEAESVCEKLRDSLTRLAGSDGFVSLMRRAISLAQAEAPALSEIKLRRDGCFDGFGAAFDGDGNEAGTALTAHLLWLLVTFVGEPIMLRLVREAWPDIQTGN